MASAQVKSCVLLAGLVAYGEVTVTEPTPSRDHTERLFARAGVSIERRDGAISISNVDELELDEVQVPGDLSSAAFLLAAGVLVPGSRLLLRDVGVNWTRAGFLRILERMGGVVVGDFEPPPDPGVIPREEPVSDIDLRAGPLVGTTVEPDEVPLAIDELPLVALLGCFAEGETIVTGRRRAAPQGIRPHHRGGRGAARPGRRDRGDRGRVRGDGHRRPRRAASSTPAATTGWPCSAPWPGSPPATA